MACRWDKGQVNEFVKQTKAEAGCGWAMLGPRLQHALLAERALYVVAGQAAEMMPSDAGADLLREMCKRAGVD